MLNLAFCKQLDVLSVDETSTLSHFLGQQPDENFFFERSYNRRGLVKQLPEDYRFVIHWNTWFKVEFDGEGKITSERVTEVYRSYPGYDRVHKIFHKAMECMAMQLGWLNSTQLMGITIMQHFNLKKGQEVGPIKWHNDTGTHSMVVLIDDQASWDGGEFLFKIGEEPVQTFIPQQGKGVVFSNEGTQHYVSPIIAKSDHTNRTILTLHRIDPLKK